MPDDAREILSKADSVELLSVDYTRMEFHPMHLQSVPSLRRRIENEDGNRFYGCEVLGRTTVRLARTRNELLEALFAGTSDVSAVESMACFKPLHGLKATHAGRTVMLLLCFECRNFYVSTDEGQRAGYVKAHTAGL